MSSIPVVYLSGPISNGGTATPDKIKENVLNSQESHARLMLAGFAVINPILTAHIDSMFDIEWDVWLTADLRLVEISDIVLRLPGASKGADREVEHAEKLGKPVFQTVEGCLTWKRGQEDARRQEYGRAYAELQLRAVRGEITWSEAQSAITKLQGEYDGER